MNNSRHDQKLKISKIIKMVKSKSFQDRNDNQPKKTPSVNKKNIIMKIEINKIPKNKSKNNKTNKSIKNIKSLKPEAQSKQPKNLIPYNQTKFDNKVKNAKLIQKVKNETKIRGKIVYKVKNKNNPVVNTLLKNNYPDINAMKLKAKNILKQKEIILKNKNFDEKQLNEFYKNQIEFFQIITKLISDDNLQKIIKLADLIDNDKNIKEEKKQNENKELNKETYNNIEKNEDIGKKDNDKIKITNDIGVKNKENKKTDENENYFNCKKKNESLLLYDLTKEEIDPKFIEELLNTFLDQTTQIENQNNNQEIADEKLFFNSSSFPEIEECPDIKNNKDDLNKKLKDKLDLFDNKKSNNVVKYQRTNEKYKAKTKDEIYDYVFNFVGCPFPENKNNFKNKINILKNYNPDKKTISSCVKDVNKINSKINYNNNIKRHKSSGINNLILNNQNLKTTSYAKQYLEQLENENKYLLNRLSSQNNNIFH